MSKIEAVILHAAVMIMPQNHKLQKSVILSDWSLGECKNQNQK